MARPREPYGCSLIMPARPKVLDTMASAPTEPRSRSCEPNTRVPQAFHVRPSQLAGDGHHLRVGQPLDRDAGLERAAQALAHRERREYQQARRRRARLRAGGGPGIGADAQERLRRAEPDLESRLARGCGRLLEGRHESEAERARKPVEPCLRARRPRFRDVESAPIADRTADRVRMPEPPELQVIGASARRTREQEDDRADAHGKSVPANRNSSKKTGP